MKRHMNGVRKRKKLNNAQLFTFTEAVDTSLLKGVFLLSRKFFVRKEVYLTGFTYVKKKNNEGYVSRVVNVKS